MNFKIKKKLSDESGISLIEVIASLIILTIVLLGFFGMFIQSAKITRNSEEIVDATYIAQMEMEKLYSQSTKNNVSIKNGIESLGYSNKDENENSLDFYKKNINTNTYVKLTLETPVNGIEYLSRVVIYVIEKNNNSEVIKAQMENTIEWRSLK